MKIIRLFILLLCVVTPSLAFQTHIATAAAVEDETELPLSNPALEARAVTLGKKLRCVVCQSESINDSQADMARDMRQLVREKISYGWSDTDVMEFLRQRYGDYILLQPRLRAVTFALWFAPLAFLGFAGWAAFYYLRRKQIDVVQLGQAGIVKWWQDAKARLQARRQIKPATATLPLKVNTKAQPVLTKPPAVQLTPRKPGKNKSRATSPALSIKDLPVTTESVADSASKPKRAPVKKRLSKKTVAAPDAANSAIIAAEPAITTPVTPTVPAISPVKALPTETISTEVLAKKTRPRKARKTQPPVESDAPPAETTNEN